MVNRTPVILVFAFSQLIPSSAWAQGSPRLEAHSQGSR